MARISSIKPEFFTSAAMARQPLSARLTFIGLWTYVDDNGVGLDNERLVLAAVWPLEEDVIATLQRTREDLWCLARAGHLKRYRSGSGAFPYIASSGQHHAAPQRRPATSAIPLRNRPPIGRCRRNVSARKPSAGRRWTR